MIGRIYKLEGNGKFYIGSTMCDLKNRLKHHRSKSKEQIALNTPLYVHFRELGWQNARIILLKEFEVSCRKELLQKECDIIKEFLGLETCLNKNLPIVTDDEKKERDNKYQRKRREENPERERDRLREWRKNNPEKWRQQTKRHNERKRELLVEKDISSV